VRRYLRGTRCLLRILLRAMNIPVSLTTALLEDMWIISDTHWKNDNIIKYCGRPMDHDRLMLNGWWDNVGPNDTILHLGDLGHTNKWDEEFTRKIELLPGNKFIILGNHDKSNYDYAGLGFTVIPEFHTIVRDPRGKNRTVYFTHAPMHSLGQGSINIHGHIHNNGYDRGAGEQDYRNVSVEVMDYKPARLRDILWAGKYQSRKDAGINSYAS
jgi:calcineurin-like phosphoesterase family protein